MILKLKLNMGSQNTVFKCLIILGSLLCWVHCEHFEFGDGLDPCILLDLDAEFDLSMGEQTADPFTLAGANVTSSQCLCGGDTASAILTLSLFPSSEPLKINFRRDKSSETVAMSVVLILDPKKHFENASFITPFELEDSDDLPIGLMNMSYKCDTEQQIYFNQDPGYSMTMKVSNLQAQAYNVEGGEYSEAIECPQDLLTTVPTTTLTPETTTMEEVTTEATTNSTVPETTVMPETTTPETPATIVPETSSPETPATLEPEPTSPEAITTEATIIPATTETSPTVPTTEPQTVPKYDVKDGNTVCIVVKGEIELVINYERNDSQTVEQRVKVPGNISATGSCAFNGTNTTQEFKLEFFDKTWSLTVQIGDDLPALLNTRQLLSLGAGETYSWKRVELIYVLDDHFDDPKEAGAEKTVTKEEDDGIFKASGQGSYKCSVEHLDVEDGVSMDFKDFQYKAFGQDDSENFPNDGISVCPKDTGDDDDDDDDTVGIVLGAVFGSIGFILLVVVGVVCLKRRRHQDYEVM